MLLVPRDLEVYIVEHLHLGVCGRQDDGLVFRTYNSRVNVCLNSCPLSSSPQIATGATSQKNTQHLLHNLPPRSVVDIDSIVEITALKSHDNPE